MILIAQKGDSIEYFEPTSIRSYTTDSGTGTVFDFDIRGVGNFKRVVTDNVQDQLYGTSKCVDSVVIKNSQLEIVEHCR